MAEPFLAEVRIFGFDFPPRGWAFCDGQILSINQNQALFSLLGTTYGGDGRTSFALPDLRGRTPIHVGQPAGGVHHPLGQRGGEERHALTLQEIPAHNHTALGLNGNAGDDAPEGNLPAKAEQNTFAPTGTLVSMGVSTTHTGAGQGHENMQPFLAMRFCIAIRGFFPSRN